jgi:HlyD family secretion protein
LHGNLNTQAPFHPRARSQVMFARYLLPALAIVSLSFAVIQMDKARHKSQRADPPFEPARSPYARTVAGVGIVEPDTENIAVGTNVPGVVKAVHIRVDDRIAAGSKLFDLDDRHMAAELVVRAAARDNAAAMLAKLEAMPRKEEIPPLEARVAEARAVLADKVISFDRAKREMDRGAGIAELYDTRKVAAIRSRSNSVRVCSHWACAWASVARAAALSNCHTPAFVKFSSASARRS